MAAPRDASPPPDQPVAPDLVAAGGGSFGGAVRRMFDRLAPRYDAFNRWASLGLDRGWRRAAVRALELTPESLVVDVATGTGDLALAVSRRCRLAVGCDFAPEMIDVAAGKATGRPNVCFQVARAEALPYVSATFDGFISAFALRNVKPVLEEVLAEAFRVLAPGGRLAILEFSRPPWPPVRAAHGLYTRTVVPRVGRWLTGTAEPFEYLCRSIQEWKSPEELAAILGDAGFGDVGWRRMGLGTVALHTARKPAA